MTDLLHPDDSQCEYLPESTPMRCAWFAMCTREATTSLPHPVLGEVPCCAMCERRGRSEGTS